MALEAIAWDLFICCKEVFFEWQLTWYSFWRTKERTQVGSVNLGPIRYGRNDAMPNFWAQKLSDHLVLFLSHGLVMLRTLHPSYEKVQAAYGETHMESKLGPGQQSSWTSSHQPAPNLAAMRVGHHWSRSSSPSQAACRHYTEQWCSNNQSNQIYWLGNFGKTSEFSTAIKRGSKIYIHNKHCSKLV